MKRSTVLLRLLALLAATTGCPDSAVRPNNATSRNGGPSGTAGTEAERAVSRPGDALQVAMNFDERAADAGIEFTYHTGVEAGHFAILESLGGGIGLLD